MLPMAQLGLQWDVENALSSCSHCVCDWKESCSDARSSRMARCTRVGEGKR